jgi:transposase-like protein
MESIMAYSQDLRHRVLAFVNAGGSKAEAARRYEIHVDTLYQWIKQPPDHQAKTPGPKDSRKFCRVALAKAVQEQPDVMLKELAQRFAVSTAVISATLRKLGLRRKKNTAVRTSVHHQQHA